ncbi:hypothetical protein Poli38472_004067 [Pythium oligandrum]|uniref:Carboxypeptidase n=1 Tax=Pythium oligandrum TaxID=41045 RepID=A0A8K1FNW8_PYTOL|nr:hypothetical protein Poli38472_004067 [Pythium oligandrum]|eukprot:TMW66302.1 hypothetical protein Poli38472_004067 [Pythium oligandrum]
MSTSERTPLNPEVPVPQDSWRPKRIVAFGAALVVAITVFFVASTFPSAEVIKNESVQQPTRRSIFDCDSVQQESGYIKLANRVDDHYFYWYFESRDEPANDPLVVWLSGGAGCSSIMALFVENGPCHIKDDITPEYNPHSWNTRANVIWLDQPSNTGFSYAASEDVDHDAEDVGANFYAFLQGFLDKHPELHGRPLFVTGESYAGHYIPNIANRIMQQKTNDERINLKGIAIGNGLMNPILQLEHTLDMVDNQYNVTLLTDKEYEQALAAQTKYASIGNEYLATGKQEYFAALVEGWQRIMTPFSTSRRNPYDIREPCYEAYLVDCYDVSTTKIFLNLENVKAELNALPTKHWLECNASISAPFFGGDAVQNHATLIADLLNTTDLRVLLYVGDADTICNWHGVKAVATGLEWKHQDEFNAAEECLYFTSNYSVTAGSIKSYKDQLTLLRLFNAGHMVPHDQPAVALEMINTFIHGDAFAT